MILAIAQLGQPGDDGREIIWICGFEFQKEFLDRSPSGVRLIKFYCKFNSAQHEYWCVTIIPVQAFLSRKVTGKK